MTGIDSPPTGGLEPVDTPPIWLAPAKEYAAATLGPRSVEALERRAVQGEVFDRLERGHELEDAVLGAMFGLSRCDQEVAGEFFGHFLGVVLRLQARGDAKGAALRRLMDADDLVQSVMGDLWPELEQLHFETRAQFLSLLAGRVRWKASDHTRKLMRRRRSEDRRVAEGPEELAISSGESSPVTKVCRTELAERVVLAMGRLSERDRQLLRLHLRGEPAATIAREVGLSKEATRKALLRAKQRLGEVFPE